MPDMIEALADQSTEHRRYEMSSECATVSDNRANGAERPPIANDNIGRSVKT